MKRQDAIALMRIAGYHSDSRSFARLFWKPGEQGDRRRSLRQRPAATICWYGCHCFKCKEAQQQQLPSNPR